MIMKNENRKRRGKPITRQRRGCHTCRLGRRRWRGAKRRPGRRPGAIGGVADDHHQRKSKGGNTNRRKGVFRKVVWGRDFLEMKKEDDSYLEFLGRVVWWKKRKWWLPIFFVPYVQLYHTVGGEWGPHWLREVGRGSVITYPGGFQQLGRIVSLKTP